MRSIIVGLALIAGCGDKDGTVMHEACEDGSYEPMGECPEDLAEEEEVFLHIYADQDGDTFVDDSQSYGRQMPASSLDTYADTGWYPLLDDVRGTSYEVYGRDPGDCDDEDSSIHPEAAEVCDGIDENCDGEIDNDAPDQIVQWRDADDDGYGNPDVQVESCERLDGYVENAQDCDDTNDEINPYAAEVCDSVDNDCDGLVDDADTDEDNPVDTSTGKAWYLDLDGDGFGDENDEDPVWACSQPAGTASNNTDCDDTEVAVNPSVAEDCEDLETDYDCDGNPGEGTAYRDGDEDGYGDPDDTTSSCEEHGGYVYNALDCDDTDPAVNPDAIEVCDDVDNDCDGTTDEGDATDATTWYLDYDGDEYGDISTSVDACTQPDSYVEDATDCDDTDENINPGAEEVCDDDDTDEDCNGLADDDDGDATGESTWYADDDEDGLGNPDDSLEACDQPTGYVEDDSDCDDADPDSSGETTFYHDGDEDGYGDPDDTEEACEASADHVDNGADCDDSDADVSPGATETVQPRDVDCDGNPYNGTEVETMLSDAGYTIALDAQNLVAYEDAVFQSGGSCDSGSWSTHSDYLGETSVSTGTRTIDGESVCTGLVQSDTSASLFEEGLVYDIEPDSGVTYVVFAYTAQTGAEIWEGLCAAIDEDHLDDYACDLSTGSTPDGFVFGTFDGDGSSHQLGFYAGGSPNDGHEFTHVAAYAID